MLSAQKYIPKELNDLQECHTHLKKYLAALHDDFPTAANKADPQYQQFVKELGDLHFDLSMNLFDKSRFRESDLIEFKEILDKANKLFARVDFKNNNLVWQEAIRESLNATSSRPKTLASSPKDTQLIQERLESFDKSRKIFISLTQDAVKKAQFMDKPKGLAQIKYAIDFRMSQLLTEIPNTPIEKNYEKLLGKVNENISAYREGNIKPIQNIIDLIDAFEDTVKNDKSPNKEKHEALLGKLVGLRSECHIIEKNHHALHVQKQLDEINLHLVSEHNTLQLQYDKALRALKVLHKQTDEPAPTGVKGFLRSFNFVADQRAASFLLAKVELDKQLLVKLENAQDRHNAVHGENIQALKEQLNTLKQSGADLTPVIAPISNASFMQIKEQAAMNQGIVIGNISQSRINELGSNAGACYGFSKEWILKMNTLIADRTDEHIMIDEQNMYARSSEREIDRIANQANVLNLDISTMKYYAEQSADKKSATMEYKKPLALNHDFYAHTGGLLAHSTPSSLMINISSPRGGNHAMGAVQDHHGGIWFHDSNFCCVYFANQTGNAQNNFQTFLEAHFKAKYPEYTSGSYIHIKDKLESGLDLASRQDEVVSLSSAPKSFTPALQAEKSGLKAAVPSVEPSLTAELSSRKGEDNKPRA